MQRQRKLRRDSAAGKHKSHNQTKRNWRTQTMRDVNKTQIHRCKDRRQARLGLLAVEGMMVTGKHRNTWRGK